MANADSTAMASTSNTRQYISLENYDIASVKAQQRRWAASRAIKNGGSHAK
jgi:hypothetical protein